MIYYKESESNVFIGRSAHIGFGSIKCYVAREVLAICSTFANDRCYDNDSHEVPLGEGIKKEESLAE